MQKNSSFIVRLVVLTVLLVSLVVTILQPASKDLSQIAPASQMMLQGQAATNTKNDQADQEKQTAHHKEEPPPKQQVEKPTEQGGTIDDTLAGDNAIETNDAEGNKVSPIIETVPDAKQGELYFTTNLINDMTVTTKLYELLLTHVQQELTVDETVITVNDEQLPPAKMTLPFEDGNNDVSIVVTYTDEKGKQITAKTNYRILLNTKTVVIQTTAKNETVTESVYRFTASASIAGEPVPVDVFLNDEQIEPLAGFTYAVDLKDGSNTLKLRAQDETRAFNIVYEESKAQLQLETDLYDQKVAIAAFSFNAKVFYKDEEHPLTVSLNGKVLESRDTYDVTLQHGTNVITLQAQADDEQLSRKYYVLFTDPSVVEEKPVDVLAPTIKTDLKDGTKVKGLIKTINVWPTTASGERIRGKDVAVKVNGVGVPFVWDDAEKTSYKLNLQDGENSVEIRAWDEDGRVTKQAFTVHAQNMEDAVIGQVTISVEASVLGIPYMIPPTKMDIRQGEKGSFIVDQLLRNKGFTYNHTGTLESNFYLSRLKKSNMLASLQIPDDLWALVEQSSTQANREDFDPNSLGEFDFANGSGWMFSVNGDYPNYGLSDAYFLDGDIVRIRYTLHYGKDIRGFGSTSADASSNWDKEW